MLEHAFKYTVGPKSVKSDMIFHVLAKMIKYGQTKTKKVIFQK